METYADVPKLFLWETNTANVMASLVITGNFLSEGGKRIFSPAMYGISLIFLELPGSEALSLLIVYPSPF